MFIETLIPSSPTQTYSKYESQSTVSSQSDSLNPFGRQVTEFSLDLQSPKHKFCSKLSKATKHTQESQDDGSDSLQEQIKDKTLENNSKAKSCTFYFNEMSYGLETDSRDLYEGSLASCNKQLSPAVSLFRLLEEYPEVALIRGNRREYSLFFN